MDLQQLLAAAQQMQDHLMSAQQELADTQVEGTSGGGLVTARVNGQGDLVGLDISAAAIDPADPEDTAQTVADLQQEKMGPLAAGLGGGMGQPGMPDMSGLFGPDPGEDPELPGGTPELPRG